MNASNIIVGDEVPLDVIQKLAHHLRPLITVFHLFVLHLLQEASDDSVQGNGEYHNGNPDKSRPSQEVVKGDESKNDLGK